MASHLANATSLGDLHDLACASGLDGLLDASAFEAIGNGRKGRQLQAELVRLVDEIGDDTLGAVLARGDEFLLGRDRRSLRLRLLRSFAAYLRRAAGRRRAADASGDVVTVAAARRERANASPPELEALPDPETDPTGYVDWARGIGLGEMLRVSLAALVESQAESVDPATRAVLSILRYITLEQFLTGTFPYGLSRGNMRQLRELVSASARRSQRAYLQGVAEEKDEDLCNRAMPDGQRVPAVVAALQRLRATLRRSVPPMPRASVPEPRVELELGAIGAQIVCDAGSGGRAVIDLEQGQQWRADSSCACHSDRQGTPCLLQLSQVDHLLRAALMPDDGEVADLMRRLIDWAGRARWERGLEEASALLRMTEESGAEQQPTERLWWAVSAERGVSVEPLVQRRGKRGNWLKPRKISPRSIDPDKARADAARDEPLLRLWGELVAVRHWGYSEGLRDYGLAQMVQHLVGHPRVCWADRPGEPIAVAKGELGVRLDEGRRGIRFDLTAAGRPMGDVELNAYGKRLHGWFLLREPDALVLVPADTRRLELAQSLTAAGEIPKRGRQRALDMVRALEDSCPVQLGDALKGEQLPAEARLVARLAPHGNAGLQLEVLVRTLDSAPLYPPGDGPVDVIALAGDGSTTWARRSLAAEVAAAARVLAPLGDLLGDAHTATVEDPERALQVVEILQQLDEVTCEWPKGKEWKVLRPGRVGDLSLRLRDAHDWFGVEGGINIDGEQVALSLLLDALRRDERYVAIDERRWVTLEDGLRERLARLEAAVHVSRGKLEVGATAAPVVEELVDAGVEVQASERWRAWADRLGASRALDPQPPPELTATLRSYQRDGYAWMARLATWGVGCCLADDMGLGKTLQALCVVAERGQAGPSLVVAPVSVCDNWEHEMKRFVPSLRPIQYRGPDRHNALADLGPNDVLVCSYALATRDVEALSAASFEILVLDEAQAIKNPSTQRAKAIAKLRADWAVALTGTPIENHLGELWALFRVLSPGLFGSWSYFRQRFGVPITNHDDEEAAAALATLVRPFVLRRTKAEVARDLPPRTTIDVDVQLSNEERRIYDETRLTTLAQLTGADERLSPEQRRFRVLAAITRLRQLACNPRLVDPDSTAPSAKLDRLMELVTVLNEEGQRALVFSQFVKHLTLVRERLEAEGLAYAYLDGSTPAARRAAIVEDFQKGSLPLFLISLKAGGSGLNLTAADNVIHLDPWWNPAVEDQASDRAHRIGQTKPVTIYRLVSRGTIEDGILALHRDKRALVEAALSGSGQAAGLSSDELVALIRDAVPRRPSR